MKTLEIEKVIKDGSFLMGSFLDEKDFDTLINFDCDVYDKKKGFLIAKFRKKALNFEVLKSAVDNTKSAIKKNDQRGAAAGKLDVSKLSMKDVKLEEKIFNAFYTNKKGVKTKFSIGNQVEDAVIGYMDRNARMPFCRKTTFVKNEFEKFKKAIPFIKKVDDLYKKLIYDKWKIQKEYALSSDINYIISDTCFSTVTINKNFQTAVHKDVGDLKSGFGNLSCFKTKGSKGGYFVLPEWRVAFDLETCDLLLVDVHQWHGNTEIINETKEDERISFVMYYRENIINCLSPKDELERVKITQKIL